MRFYGKKFLKHSIQRAALDTVESRDAIVWEILTTQRLCRVKIQGSNEYIVAHYPENWEKTPYWLRKGNAVRITHMGGIRGRIEVVGCGQMVHTPISGSTFPIGAIPEDGVLEGCRLKPVPNNPKMVVQVTVGTYRIGGIEYDLDAIPMAYGDYFVLGDGGSIDVIAGAIAINAAPSTGNYRYDLISVGIDGVIDYTAGTPATADPVMPDPAINHIILGHILVHYGMTEILRSDINRHWRIPMSRYLNVVPADTDLAWTELSTDVVVSVTDQYENGISSSGYGWYAILEIIQGNGKVSSVEEGESTTKIGSHFGTANHCHFTYTRNQTVDDKSVVLKAVLEIDKHVAGYAYITLRDSVGNPM